MPKPTMAATPAIAPTPMPAFAPVLSPLEVDESGELVDRGRIDVGPGAGEVGTPAGLTVRPVGVKDTPICLASDAAYAGGNFDRSVTSQATLIASARAMPYGTNVAFESVAAE
jgi:hypothetical protein